MDREQLSNYIQKQIEYVEKFDFSEKLGDKAIAHTNNIVFTVRFNLEQLADCINDKFIPMIEQDALDNREYILKQAAAQSANLPSYDEFVKA